MDCNKSLGQIHPKLPPRIVLHAEYTGEAILCCPVCGDTYVHPSFVAVDQEKSRTTVTGNRTLTEPGNRGENSRGSSIVVAFYCESGHQFQYVLTFSKGNTYFHLLRDDDIVLDVDVVPELWRS